MSTVVGWRRRASGIAVKLAASGLVVAAVSGAGTWAAFSGTTGNAANSMTAGTVVLTDDDAGAAMFSLSGLKPGDGDSACILVTYTGRCRPTSGCTGPRPAAVWTPTWI